MASQERLPAALVFVGEAAVGKTTLWRHGLATALFVSVKGVEANLSRIYEKLAVRSRSELAHKFAREWESKL